MLGFLHLIQINIYIDIYIWRTLSIECEEAQQTVVAQMKEWENNPCPEPIDGKPNGQKCKYKVLYK